MSSATPSTLTLALLGHGVLDGPRAFTERPYRVNAYTVRGDQREKHVRYAAGVMP